MTIGVFKELPLNNLINSVNIGRGRRMFSLAFLKCKFKLFERKQSSKQDMYSPAMALKLTSQEDRATRHSRLRSQLTFC